MGGWTWFTKTPQITVITIYVAASVDYKGPLHTIWLCPVALLKINRQKRHKCALLCVCVCVQKREKDRERERERERPLSLEADALEPRPKKLPQVNTERC